MVAMDRGHIVAQPEAHPFDSLGEIVFHPVQRLDNLKKRIKGFCAAQPAQKAGWGDAGAGPVGL